MTDWAELSGPAGQVFRFRVVAYEFPDRAPTDDHDYDANWLRIDVLASDGIATWKWDREPAWLTWDLPRLRSWFVAVLDGTEPDYDWCSLEPLVTFSNTPEGVGADVDCGIPAGGGTREHHILSLAPTESQLQSVIAVVDEAIANFPPR